MKHILSVLLILLSLSLNVSSHAAETDNKASLSANKKLQGYLASLESYEANFTQQVLTNNDTEFDRTEGQFVLKRPNRFRWEVKTPYQQTIIADGKVLYSIDHDLEQVTLADLEQSLTNSPIQILSKANQDLDAVFETEFGESDDRYEFFILTPKDPSATFEQILLGFSDERLASIELFDSLGQITVVRLLNVRVNPILGNEAFEYKPIEGYDVIDTRESITEAADSKGE